MLPILFPNRFRRNDNHSVPHDTTSVTPKALEDHGQGQHSQAGQHEAIFGMLTDDVLLEIFDWYQQTSMEEQCNGTWDWIVLVHVCRRWRNIVFDSPGRLDLRLLCTYGTPARRLDCWSSLPIVIKYWPNSGFKPPSPEDEDTIIAALEHPDRVSAIQLAVTSSLWEKVAERMQVPFPVLTSLSLWLDQGTAQSRPATFLTGVAFPRLKDISLIGIPFPSRPWGLLASASDLVALRLLEVPGAGYTAPDMMATYLSMLPHLRTLCINFHSPPSHRSSQEHKRPTSVTRAVLPSLAHFNFRGTNEYFEDLMARIDAPFPNHQPDGGTQVGEFCHAMPSRIYPLLANHMCRHGLAGFVDHSVHGPDIPSGLPFLQCVAPRKSRRLYSKRKRDGLAGVFELIFLREAAHCAYPGNWSRSTSRLLWKASARK